MGKVLAIIVLISLAVFGFAGCNDNITDYQFENDTEVVNNE